MKMIDSGMQIARLDLSEQASNEILLERVTILGQAALERRANVALMVDLQGPQIRTGSNKDGAVLPISAGQPLKIVSDMEIEGDVLTIATTFPLPVSVDQTIYIADGQLSCVVQSIEGDVIEVKCQNSWDLEQNSTVHLPGVPLDMFQPTEKDIADITSFILENQIDYVQIPSVKKPEEV